MDIVNKAFLEYCEQGCFAIDTALELSNQNIDPDALLEEFLTGGLPNKER